MDMFMDKLAQKLNAQEIIKANSAADAEEMTRLKNRIGEYNQCLDRLQKLIEQGEAGLQNSQVSKENVNRLVAESIEKIQAIQQDTTGLDELLAKISELQNREQLEADFAAVSENMHRECVKVYRNVQAVVVEENEKQTKAQEETSKAVGGLRGKLGAVLGISVVAMLFSMASLALQILNLLNIKLF